MRTIRIRHLEYIAKAKLHTKYLSGPDSCEISYPEYTKLISVDMYATNFRDSQTDCIRHDCVVNVPGHSANIKSRGETKEGGGQGSGT